MSEKIPDFVQAQIDREIPELSIFYANDGGWMWTFRCTECEGYFETWEQALLDFAVSQSDALDESMGLFEE